MIRMTPRHAAQVLVVWLLCHLGVSVGSEAWHLASDSEGVRIYHPTAADPAAHGIRAELVFQAPPEQVHRAITDYDHFAEFVPDVTESSVIRCAGHVRWVHQRLEFPPPVAAREYVLQITDRLHPAPGVYARIDWTLDPSAEYGVQRKDAVAPRRFTGFWVLRPVQSGNATAAAYGVQFDAGGVLPQWLVIAMIDRYALSVIDAVRDRIGIVALGSGSGATSAHGAEPSTGDVTPLASWAGPNAAGASAGPGCGTSRAVPESPRGPLDAPRDKLD
jgi:Polyketide cyclase / dehydrase and lipid transport